ncbi:hypothetical protein N9Y42_02210 [Mariniblastus sp.]|nr:hypothetical protein [Mariniblastus sp.]
MFFWNRNGASEFENYSWDETDPPPTSWYVQRLFFFVLIVVVGISVGAALYGQTMAEKSVTALMQPIGLVWLGLSLVVYFCLLWRRYVAASACFLCWLILTVAGNQIVSNSLAASSDRLTRDCVGFYDQNEKDSDLENIVPKPYNSAAGETSFESLKKILLSQPDAIIAPTIADSETMDLLAQQANEQERAVIIRAQASTAAEAFLRTYAQSKDRNAFLSAAKSATCQRLLRRLCDDCRVQVRVQPQMIQKLGGNPKKQGSLFNQYKLPPPAQRVDEKGNPIEFPPCTTCGGAGYIGRIAVFELLQLDEQLRAFIRKQPQAAAIEAAAVKLGKTSLINQAYKLVLLGVTSIAEVQRVFNPPKKKS